MSLNIGKKIDIYIRLRDRRAKRKAEYEEADRPDREAQEKIEAQIMEQFNADGTDSLKTEFGTAYRSMKTSATVADWEAVLEFVKDQEFWTLLEKRVNKTAVEEYLDLNEKLPPGVNVTKVATINVRRS